VIEGWKRRARRLKTESYALFLAYRDRRVPWGARLFALLVVAYALSPIDLIPDPIPVLGYLDDLILIPLGIYIAIRLIPPPVLAECRQRAAEELGGSRPVMRFSWVLIVLVWIGMAALLLAWLINRF
jgi:uncharacterized membrane protein YkvA (DUF1232 family)